MKKEKENWKYYKRENGITLLALVITIIIMLLLAGVAIQMTIGENGLFAKATNSKKSRIFFCFFIFFLNKF